MQGMELAPSLRHAADLGHAFAGQCVETCVVGTDDRDFPVAHERPGGRTPATFGKVVQEHRVLEQPGPS